MAHIKVISAWQTNFLRQVQQGHHVTIAAKKAGVGLEKLYHTRTIDIEFARKWEDTKKEANERIGKTVAW